MNRVLSYEQLSLLIRKYARFGIESRQVAQRLGRLLPEQLKQLQKQRAKEDPSSGLTYAMRVALGSEEYVEQISRLSDMAYQAHAARIQYETHLMLVEARRTMRAFHNR